MAINSLTLLAFTFVSGALIGSFLSNLWLSEDGETKTEQKQVAGELREPITKTAHTRRGETNYSHNTPIQPFSNSDSSDISIQAPGATSNTGNNTNSQHDEFTHNSTQKNAFVGTAPNHDIAIQDEQYSRSDATYEREETLKHQKEIISREEEANLYEAPPNDIKLSSEEQDALEREIINTSNSAYNRENDFILQQTIENEAKLNEIYADQVGITEEIDDE